MDKNLLKQFQLFDSHFHIIDNRFPITPNNGYTPAPFTYKNYLERVALYDLCGGAIVSGSFQAFDQTYLIDALTKLGSAFVGVTQLPRNVSDDEIIRLKKLGVRAIRFNMKRGGSEEIAHLSTMANRVYEIADWHTELYIDSRNLPDLYNTLITLPSISIDHLGLSNAGFSTLLKLVEKGAHVKATGFSRTDFDVKTALKDLYSANPAALMFGTDLPSTRAPSPYHEQDFLLVANTFDAQAAQNIFSQNALAFYKPSSI